LAEPHQKIRTPSKREADTDVAGRELETAWN
jgi:hypothetical protein